MTITIQRKSDVQQDRQMWRAKGRQHEAGCIICTAPIYLWHVQGKVEGQIVRICLPCWTALPR